MDKSAEKIVRAMARAGVIPSNGDTAAIYQYGLVRVLSFACTTIGVIAVAFLTGQIAASVGFTIGFQLTRMLKKIHHASHLKCMTLTLLSQLVTIGVFTYTTGKEAHVISSLIVSTIVFVEIIQCIQTSQISKPSIYLFLFCVASCIPAAIGFSHISLALSISSFAVIIANVIRRYENECFEEKGA